MDVVWVRRDARLHDNAVLAEAAKSGRPVGVIVVFDDRWVRGTHCHFSHCQFVAEGLREMNAGLQQLTGSSNPLACFTGRTESVLAALHRSSAGPIHSLWSHIVVGDAEHQMIDKGVGEWCRRVGCQWQQFDQYGLVEGGRLVKGKSVFARNFEEYMQRPQLEPAVFKVVDQSVLVAGGGAGPTNFICDGFDWCTLGVPGSRRPEAQKGGEMLALEMLQDFLERRCINYSQGLSSPVSAWVSCSRLSTYLAWGQISLRRVVQETSKRQAALRGGCSTSAGERVNIVGVGSKRRESWLGSLSNFQSRLRWRTHFMQKLFDEPRLAMQNLCTGYDEMRNEGDLSPEEHSKLIAWVEGNTGFPLVDACMRALAQSGWINFRMRCMIVSFASYHLWLSWKHFGPYLARLFLDYEPGIHYPQIQMQAGTTGINSNRIYCPNKQILDHDPNGDFIMKYVHELQGLEAQAFKNPSKICALGYPKPIVEAKVSLKTARGRLREFNYSVKHGTTQAQEAFHQHGSRRPNAGDLAKSNVGRHQRTDEAFQRLDGSQNGDLQHALLTPCTPVVVDACPVSVEIAPTSRSVCRVCKEKIPKGNPRCSQETLSRGRVMKLFAHAKCFLQKMRCEYASAKRGRFEKGMLRVQLGALKATWLLPSEAKGCIPKILQALRDVEVDELIHNVQGLESLRCEDRSTIVDLLSIGSQPGMGTARTASEVTNSEAQLRTVLVPAPNAAVIKNSTCSKKRKSEARRATAREAEAAAPAAQAKAATAAAESDVERPPLKRLRRLNQNHAPVIDLASD